MAEQNNEQTNLAAMLQNYAERVEKGHIFWTKSPTGTAILNVKQFDAAHNEIGTPFQMEFSSQQVGKIENDIKRQILALEDNKLDIENAIDNLKRELKSGVIAKIKDDVKKAEDGDGDK